MSLTGSSISVEESSSAKGKLRDGQVTHTEPVAHEIAVVATGARPGSGGAKRDLFTENTQTVLLFENGAVIRLAAAVATGQLLFITNKENNREVVAQVIRKRSYRPTSCYAELEFTEASPDFWGISITAKIASATQEERAANSSTSAGEDSDDDTTEEAAAPTPAPNAAEVSQLKQEVEALRAQLQSFLQTVPTMSTAAEAMLTPKVATEVQIATAGIDESAEEDKSFAAANLLPKPNLDFSQAPERELVISSGHSLGVPNSTSKKGWMIGIAATLMIAAAGAAWYAKWPPAMALVEKISGKTTTHAASTEAAKPSPATKEPQQSAASPSTIAVPAIASPTTNNSVAANPAPALPTPAPPASETAAAKDASLASGAKEATPEARNAVTKDEIATSTKLDNSITKPEEPEKPAAILAGKKKSHTARTETTSVASASDVPAMSAPIIPPRLVTSVKPIYPMEALRSFVGGNVTMEALVDASGRVKSATVQSGPAALRGAALDAVKQYKYQPATQSGKPVPAHVDVTVRFWVEP